MTDMRFEWHEENEKHVVSKQREVDNGKISTHFWSIV